MKIYLDLQRQVITKTTDENIYQGDIYSNAFEILFYNYTDSNWFPTMSQLAPNGRKAGEFTADALNVGETHEYTEDGVTYLKFTFTMGTSWVLMKGRSEFYIWFNRLGGAIVQKKCVGVVNIMIDHSTEDYFIADPTFNPSVKAYIDYYLAALGDGSPKYFDTASNIANCTEDKGLAVATDTGHLYYWDETKNSTTKYTDSGLVYNDLSAYYTKTEVDSALSLKADKTTTYTKTESDNTFAPKSNAITHNGNQLQDYSGNNIYPNLDAKTQAKIDNAYGPAYVGKDTSTNILAKTSNQGIWVGTDTGHWYYWNGTQYVDGGVYQATQIGDNSIYPSDLKDSCNSPVFKNNSVVLTKDNLKCASGYYSAVNTIVASSHKCISIPITNNKCKLSTSVSSGLSLSVGFLITNDNGVINLGNTSKSNISMANIKELQLNFFNGYTIEFTITFDDTLDLSLNDIKDTITYTKANMNCNSGYYEQSSNNIILHPSLHNSLKIALNKDVKLDYEILQQIAVYGGYIEYQDNTIINLGLDVGTYSRVIRNGKNLYLNFFDSFLESFTLSVIDNSNNEIELKYDDYVKSNYDFTNKKILFVGDSITKGFTSGSSITQNSYPKLFSDYVGATFVNNAVGGALYTSGYNQIDTLLTQLTNTSNKDTFDYVVLAGGTNDYGLSVTESDFRNAVTATIEYALNNFANAHIIVITPISFLRNNTNAISLQTYRNIITELAITEDVNTSNRVSVVQGYKFDMPQEQTSAYKTLLLNDGVHPTEEGYKVYTRGLVKALCNR